MKGKDPSFDFKKLSFVAEAAGVLQEQHIADAQSSVHNARKQSLQAAWKLFATSVSNDQVVHQRHKAALDLSSTRHKGTVSSCFKPGGQ